MRVAILGGAGFIGSHTVDGLLARGHDVTVFDALVPQIHGDVGRPEYLNDSAEFIEGDVRDRTSLTACIKAADAIVFMAAVVGVGQSMYEIHRYVDANTLGIATLLDVLATENHAIQKLVIASSMSVYGEGAYECANCGQVEPPVRSLEALAGQTWEPLCPVCDAELRPTPTPESKRMDPRSVYAITKRDQEELGLIAAPAHGITTVALRYFNCYGSRQAVSNPYTGAVAILARSMATGTAPTIYEDGLQTRDFIHVDDVVQANVQAIERHDGDSYVLNVGTGHPTSILELVQELAAEIGYKGDVQITGRYRSGDIRHCHADTSRLRELLGFSPQIRLREGLASTLEWLMTQPVTEPLPDPHAELARRGLLR